MKSNRYTPTTLLPTLAAVVVFRNNAAHVDETMRRLIWTLSNLQQDWAVELLLVDDASTDDTPARLMPHVEALKRFRCRLHRTATSRGFGAALRDSLPLTNGSVVCTMDGACTYPPEEMSNMLKILTVSGCDIVTGSPYHPSASQGSDLPPARTLSKSACRIYRMLVPAKLYSYTCFFRVYRRAWLMQHGKFSDSYLGVTENLIDLAFAGASILEYPIRLSKRDYGKNTRQTLGVIGEHLGLIGRVLVKNMARSRHQPRPWPLIDPTQGIETAAVALATKPKAASGASGGDPNETTGSRSLSSWALIDRRNGH